MEGKHKKSLSRSGEMKEEEKEEDSEPAEVKKRSLIYIIFNTY